jgi:hypothetical protein
MLGFRTGWGERSAHPAERESGQALVERPLLVRDRVVHDGHSGCWPCRGEERAVGGRLERRHPLEDECLSRPGRPADTHPGEWVPPAQHKARARERISIGRVWIARVQQAGILRCPRVNDDLMAGLAEGADEQRAVLRNPAPKRGYWPNIGDAHAIG